MRTFSLVIAAMITIFASCNPASAQATNTAPTPGTAKTLSGTGSDVKANQQNTGGALSQTCESKAVSKTGKQLTGAAKTSFIKKCKVDACSGKAVSSEGKALSGAAKSSFLKKCQTDA